MPCWNEPLICRICASSLLLNQCNGCVHYYDVGRVRSQPIPTRRIFAQFSAWPVKYTKYTCIWQVAIGRRLGKGAYLNIIDERLRRKLATHSQRLRRFSLPRKLPKYRYTIFWQNRTPFRFLFFFFQKSFGGLVLTNPQKFPGDFLIIKKAKKQRKKRNALYMPF